MGEDPKLFLSVFTYGPDQRRSEIELRPTVPVSVRGNPAKINAWIESLVMTIGPDFKHTNEWGCEICGKPSRESKYNITSWAHLTPPRMVIYIHSLCAIGPNPCYKVIKQQELQMAALAGAPLGSLSPELDVAESNGVFPLASSCANCKDEMTAQKEFKISRCGGCRLTRYCCPGCQKADWPRHKKACKIVESVKWVHWPGSS